MVLYSIFRLFCTTSSLEANNGKSCIYHLDGSVEMLEFIGNLFDFCLSHFDIGISYLSFHLKAYRYLASDWTWILKWYKKRIQVWSRKWLTRGVRLVLVQAILQQLIVYWAHLYYMPMKIIKQICSIMADFIWNGGLGKYSFHLEKWELITRPKDFGGWGVRDLVTFGQALMMKSLWRCLHTPGVWKEIVEFNTSKISHWRFYTKRRTHRCARDRLSGQASLKYGLFSWKS